MMRVIGITGGVGSGKSRVLDFLRDEYGAVVVQLDAVAKELQAAGQPCFERIVERFGEEIVGADGELDRAKLGRIVFADARKLKILNEIVHPEVKEWVRRDISLKKSADTPVYVIEAALLPGAGYEDICEEMWYIYTDESVRRERLRESRGYSDEQITRMIAAQPDEDTFRKTCSVVIDNSGSFEKTRQQIQNVLEDNRKR